MLSQISNTMSSSVDQILVETYKEQALSIPLFNALRVERRMGDCFCPQRASDLFNTNWVLDKQKVKRRNLVRGISCPFFSCLCLDFLFDSYRFFLLMCLTQIVYFIRKPKGTLCVLPSKQVSGFQHSCGKKLRYQSILIFLSGIKLPFDNVVLC